MPPLLADASLIGDVTCADASSSSVLPPAPVLAIYPDAVTEAEEERLVREANKWLAKLKWEHGHFDRVITGYRECQKPLRAFTPGSRQILERLVAFAFPPDAHVLPVHVLDLHEEGHIMRHVDHVDYSGSSIVGLSLLTGATMTLHHEPRGFHDPPRPPATADAKGRDGGDMPEPLAADTAPWLALTLPRRSLYVLRGAARYEWAHAISRYSGLTADGKPGAEQTPRGRRLAMIFRDAKEEN